MKKFVIIILLVLSFLFLAQLAVNPALTNYMSDVFIPRATGRFGIEQASVHISKLGLFETTMGPVRLGDGKTTFFEAGSITVRYTPFGLMGRHIKQLTASGLIVNTAWRENTLSLPGFSRSSSGDTEKNDDSWDWSWPVTFGDLTVSSGLINVAVGDNCLQVPVTLNLKPADRAMNRVDGRLELYPRGQEISLKIRLDKPRGIITTRLEAPAVRLENFSDWFARIPGLDVMGQVAVSAGTDLTIAPLRLTSAEMDLSLNTGRAAFQDLVLEPVNEQTPLSIHVSGSTKKGWQAKGSSGVLSSPVSLRFAGFEGAISPVLKDGQREGSFSVFFDRSAETSVSGFRFLSPVTIRGGVEITVADNSWQGTITRDQAASDPTACRVQSGDIIVDTTVPAFTVSTKGTVRENRFAAYVALPQTDITVGTEKTTIEKMVLRAAADMRRTPDDRLAASGNLELAIGTITAMAQQITIKQAGFDFPFQWPETSRKKGTMTIGPLTWQGRDFGRLTGDIRQKGSGAGISGVYRPGSVPGLNGSLSVLLGMTAGKGPKLEAVVRLNHRAEKPDIDLGRLLPQAAGIFLNADLDTMASVSLNEGRLTGRLTTAVTSGRVRLPEKKIAVTGIKAGLTIPDLRVVKSDPDQKMMFQQATLGDIQVSDGEIDFQLESPRTVFIEKSGFKWCRGSVYAEGMRITPDSDAYRLTLYSDRLNLADLLRQIGAIDAEGNGTVSGRIPISYQDGGISINNGFLYSAPGEGGIIYLRKAEILTAGVPKNSPQYAQIDLAREALKNYQYDWARVGMSSEDDNLHIKLSFDGRPGQPLPFVYDRKKGTFVRGPDDGKRSEFKGLSLDVNFRIPLNELIGYKGVLGM